MIDLLTTAIEQAQIKQWQIAADILEQALALEPKNATVLCNYGNVLHELERVDESMAAFNLAIAQRPDYLLAHLNKGLVLLAEQRYVESMSCFDAVLEFDSNHADARTSREIAMANVNRDAAQEKFDLGVEQQANCHYAQACDSYDAALALVPYFSPASWNQSLCRLMLGQLHRGWELAESRWDIDQFRGAKRHYHCPLWLGQESIAGKIIYLWPEQGFGDTWQFSRYALVLEEMGAKVILGTEKSTLRLLQNSFESLGIKVILDRLDISELNCDFHAPLMSLPLGCGTKTVTDIPANTPYLKPLVNDCKEWKRRVNELSLTRGLRVGLVWAGGYRPHNLDVARRDSLRSLQLEFFSPLMEAFNQQNVHWFSLQLGEGAKQLALAKVEKNVAVELIDLTQNLSDWGDTAALIAQMDLVISCDTAVAHLAAAMNKPTWILSRYNGCWRWLEERDDSPWYQSVRLFRQTTPQDWGQVIQRVEDALSSRIKAKRPAALCLS